MVWAPLLQLSRLDRLQSLSVDFAGDDGTGLQYLERSADGLAGLRFLGISLTLPSLVAGLSFISRLVGLSELSLDAPRMAPPAWLSSLTALSRITAELELDHTSITALAALPALAELDGVRWAAGAGGALPAACCPSVAVLGSCVVFHAGLASLAAAFPGLREASLGILDGFDSHAEAPHSAAMPQAPAAWCNLRDLRASFDGLEERHLAAAFNSLLSLLRGAGELTSLELTSEEVDDDEYYEGTAFWSDTDVAALLAHAPATLESLTVYPVAALTDAAFIGCSLRPALKALRIRWSQPPQLMLIGEPLQVTPVGLLALGWALPGLEHLRLSIVPGKFDGGYDEQRKRALIGQLDAMCGGGGGGVQQRRAPPALGSHANCCEHCGRCVDGDSDSDSEDDDELLLAIRRVRARFTY